MFFIIVRLKNKLTHLIKLVMALAILIILITQLAGAFQQASETYRRWINRDNPHGNPIKVQKDIDEIILDSGDPLINKLKIHREKNQPVE